MTEYAQKECFDCHGLFPGNLMRRCTTSAMSKSIKPFDPRNADELFDSSRTTTTYSDQSILLCQRCFDAQKSKQSSVGKWLIITALIVIGAFVAVSSFVRFSAVGTTAAPTATENNASTTVDPNVLSGRNSVVMDDVTPRIDKAATDPTITDGNSLTSAASDDRYQNALAGDGTRKVECTIDGSARNSCAFTPDDKNGSFSLVSQEGDAYTFEIIRPGVASVSFVGAKVNDQGEFTRDKSDPACWVQGEERRICAW